MVSNYFHFSYGTLFGILVQYFAKCVFQNFSPFKSFTIAILCLCLALSRLQWLCPTQHRRAPCSRPPSWASAGPWCSGARPCPLARQALGALRPGQHEREHSGRCGGGSGGGDRGRDGVTLTVGNKPSHAPPRPRSVSASVACSVACPTPLA